MGLKALFYAYVIGGVTFIPLVLCAVLWYTYSTSVPVEPKERTNADVQSKEIDAKSDPSIGPILDVPRPKKGWLTMRRTFEPATGGTYVGLITSFLDSRSKDPKRSRPKDQWFVVLKGKIMYLYEDEAMTECEAVLELGGHKVTIYPPGQIDGELFAKRNAICLTPKTRNDKDTIEPLPSVTKAMKIDDPVVEAAATMEGLSPKTSPVSSASSSFTTTQQSKTSLSWFSSNKNNNTESAAAKAEAEEERRRRAIKEKEEMQHLPWYIFPPTTSEMEDWYFALIHASENPPNAPTLDFLQKVFKPTEMNHLVTAIDDQPDVIPMRWFNALIGRVFFSYYRTHALEDYIIRQMMRKISKVKRPNFLSDIVVTEVSVGNTAPTFSKPMLKELTKEGDAAMEVKVHYKGEVRVTVEATATINLGARFKGYNVHLVLACVLREIEGNLLVKIKRPPSSRLWYAFTQPPRMVLDVEPVVSDRQLTWTMILNTIKSRVEEIVLESMVLPNMDDISFFDSSDLLRRGGIFDDAARRERVNVPVPVTTQPEDGEPGPVTPNPEFNVHPASPVETEEISVVRSTSSDKLSTENNNTRRRTWFANSSSGDQSGLVDSATEDPSSAPTSASSSRGRSTTVGSSASVRSRSTPDDTPETSTTGHDRTVSDQGPSEESPHKRSFSTRSGPSSPAFPTSSPESATRTFFSGSALARTNTQSSASSSQTTTSSILASLRNRNPDKPLISDQAKQNFRNWTSSWGAKRRPTTGNDGSMFDDASDGGSGRQRTDSTRSNISDRGISSSSTSSISIPAFAGQSRPRPSDNASPPLYGSPPRRHIEPKAIPPVVSRATHESTSNGHISIENETVLPPSSSRVYTQPMQTKSMMIPGIHASHRGDVMSMGYSVPQTQTAEIGSAPSNPVIPNMYRLWKGANAPQSGTSPPVQSDEMPPKHDDDNTDADVAVSETDKPILVASKTQPELPIRHESLAPRPSITDSEAISEPILSKQSPLMESSPASVALQSIADRDQLVRNNSSNSLEEAVLSEVIERKSATEAQVQPSDEEHEEAEQDVIDEDETRISSSNVQ